MRISYIALGIITLSHSSLTLAEEVPPNDEGSILVTATRAKEPLELGQYAGSATILSSQELGQRQTRNIADILRDVSGVAVSQVAGQTQLRLRGSEGNHVLVLVDGIEVSDPFAGEFDFGTLQAGIGGRVEVLRGPQSSLYGSDAIGGVVAYQSASGCNSGPLTAYGEGGSNETFNAAFHAGLCGQWRELALSASFVSTEGTPNARGGLRDIGSDSLTLSAKGSLDIAPNASLRGVVRYSATDGNFNDQDFNPASPTLGLVVDSLDVRFENEALYALIGLRFEANSNWSHDLSAQIADVSRDSFSGDARTFGNEGQRLKASYATTLKLAGPVFAHQITLASDWERESYRNTDPFGFAFTGTRNARNLGFVGEYRLAADRFDLSAVIRHDINNRFADATTFRVSGGVNAGPATRLRAAYGSGIKNPGFYELYGFFDGRFIGNEDLRPEKSTGWEVGIDQRLVGDALVISATWFDSKLENEIFTSFPPPNFIATPANRDTKSTRKGLELSARTKIGPQITLDAAYSWLDSEENGVDEVRRPDNIASAVLTWTAADDRGSASLILRYNGAADDLAFSDPSFIPLTVRLDDYTLVNLNARFQLNHRIEVFGRAENLFNETYEQVFSFVSQGRSVIAGVKFSL
ncbi:MAG TPA: TonB-dependent receptor [Erythrobacter sp.]|nr:TonB-dependent receptor [Erythrobacter sp.]